MTIRLFKGTYVAFACYVYYFLIKATPIQLNEFS